MIDDQTIGDFSDLEVGLGKKVIFENIHILITESPKRCQQLIYHLFTSIHNLWNLPENASWPSNYFCFAVASMGRTLQEGRVASWFLGPYTIGNASIQMAPATGSVLQ